MMHSECEAYKMKTERREDKGVFVGRRIKNGESRGEKMSHSNYDKQKSR